ncbi:MAG: hypothetical protein M3R52_13130 [Acidobacteriota bacterium]|nr:hypothetical protein [Acidobacteriota bacterium]
MAESHSLERPRFFTGKLVTAEDLALEQLYFLEKLKRHNRSLHGFGIVSGLKVTTDSGKIAVDAGMALDCQGNEVVIGTVQMLSPTTTSESWRTAYANIRYAEDSGAPATITTIAGATEVSTIREGFEIVIGLENCNRGHSHVRARWLACGEPHALTIAKLRHNSQGWRVDRRYRPPTIK